jgi:transcription elongation factor SPT6
MALQLANDFRIYSVVRKIYRAHAKLSTEPTEQGLKIIDPFHYAHSLQFLTNKPLKSFLDFSTKPADFCTLENPAIDDSTQFLWLMKAEADGLLTVNFVDPSLDTFMNILEPPFLSPTKDEEWDSERTKVLESMLHDFILPRLRVDLRAEVEQSSNKRACMQGAAKLKTMAEMAPYRPCARDWEYDDQKCLQELSREKLDCIMAICIAENSSEPNFVVYIDSNGQLMEQFTIDGLRGERLDQLIEKLKDDMETQKPMCVVLNTAAQVTCRILKEKLENVSNEILEAESKQEILNKGGGDDKSIPHRIHITYENDEVAQLFSCSKRAEEEFPTYHPMLRRAVGLARFVQNPVAELAAMWKLQGGDEETCDLLSLNLHPLQQNLPKSLLMNELEKVFVDVLNDVGVDVNQACRYAHLMPQIHFVAGLGPRKAQILKHAWTKKGIVQQRKEMHGLFGPVVFKNAAGFIRIRRDDTSHDHDPAFNKLDDTRIHPDLYDDGINIIKSALDIKDDNTSDTVDTSIEELIHAADYAATREKQQSLKNKEDPVWSLDHGREISDALARLSIEAKETGMPVTRFNLIKRELRFPFRDRRPRRRDLTTDELFEIVTGETKMSFRAGMNVDAVVSKVKDKVVECHLCNMKVRGVIFIEDQKRRNTNPPTHELGFAEAEGEVVELRLSRVEKDRFTCILESDPNLVFELPGPDELPMFDPFCDRERARTAYMNRLRGLRPFVEEDSTIKQRKERIIDHSSFKNLLSLKEAVAYLSGEDKVAGDIVFRPSSQDDCLFLTWLVHTRPFGSTQRLIVNMVIEEKDKANAVQVGQKLKIKDKMGEYDELDEILVSHTAFSLFQPHPYLTNNGGANIYIRFILYFVLTTHL